MGERKHKPRLPEKQSKLVYDFKAKNDKQQELVDLITDREIVIATGPAGTGKTYVTLATALSLLGQQYKKVILVKSVTTIPGEEIGFLKGPQPLYSKISTPNGWVDMGDLHIGDIIHAYDGSVCNITSISERNIEDVYKITLADGRHTFASSYHKWFVEKETRDLKKSQNLIVTTLDIINDQNPNNLYFLPIHKSVEYNYSKLEIDPYLLGVLIGDGCISNSHIRFASNDVEIIEKVTNIVNTYGLSINKCSDKNIIYTISNGRSNSQKGARILARKNLISNEIEILGTLKDANFRFGYPTSRTLLLNRCVKESVIDNWKYFFTGDLSKSTNYVKNILEDLDIVGKKSYDKSIPYEYLYASKEDRIELLRGLLDTDGSIKPNGSDITYVTTSEKLAMDVKQLTESLGGLAKITTQNNIGREQILDDNLIMTKRLSYTVYLKFYNNDINPFYLQRKAERFIPKIRYKNATRIKSIELVGKDIVQCITIDHPSNMYLTDEFIPTHNSMEQKMEPFIMSYMWNIDKICGDNSAASLLDKKIIEVLPLAFIRGLSIDNSIVIIDEAQNIDNHTFKTMMTRIGDNSKYILLGDSEQIDRRKKSESCLSKVIEIFKDSPIIGSIEFTDEDCVRNPIIPIILGILRENNI